MVSELPLILPLGVDTSWAERELLWVDSYINKVTTLWAKTKRLIMKEGRTLLRGIGSLINSVKLTIKALGGTLDPAMEAILTMVLSTITAMTSISLAYAAGGPLAWPSMILAAAGLGIAIGTQAAVLQHGDKITRDLDAAQAAILSWSTTFSSFQGTGTWSQ